MDANKKRLANQTPIKPLSPTQSALALAAFLWSSIIKAESPFFFNYFASMQQLHPESGRIEFNFGFQFVGEPTLQHNETIAEIILLPSRTCTA